MYVETRKGIRKQITSRKEKQKELKKKKKKRDEERNGVQKQMT